ncbi:MAG: hypothetical protein K2X82_29505 [Gemmataceae bacterium]|nr:hypothetical protein [Gemmataceae bacterium]
MAGPTPVVRQLIVCDRLTVDRDGTYRLIGPRVDFVAGPDEFPLTLPEVWVFAQVAGSFGRQYFRLRLLDVTDPTAAPVLISEERPRAVDFGLPLGPHRLRSRGWAVRLRDLKLPAPGRYELQMDFGGTPGKLELFVEGDT